MFVLEKNRFADSQKYIPRPPDNPKNNGMAKVITGVRRSGKSFLMNELFYQYLVDQGVNRNHIIRFAI